MNDAAWDPAVNRPTIASSSPERFPDTCRICRSEGNSAEPLFHPCKCSGSIKFVHQDCLMEWLTHSNKKHCELCKTPFRFTKLYDADMPHSLPWIVFGRSVAWHLLLALLHLGRLVLVALVWLGIMPWTVRWLWRWVFWVADAGWTRVAFLETLERERLGRQEAATGSWVHDAFQHLLTRRSEPLSQQTTPNQPLMLAFAQSLGFVSLPNTTAQPALRNTSATSWPSPDSSILSSWSYLSSLTPSDLWNRIILDIFEGQLITCLVITGFILVFLIREWVVQQQPPAQPDALARPNNANARDHDALARNEVEDERDQAARNPSEDTLDGEQALTGHIRRRPEDPGDSELMSWELVETLFDEAAGHLKGVGARPQIQFRIRGDQIARQIALALRLPSDEANRFAAQAFERYATYDAETRKAFAPFIAQALASTANGPDSATFEKRLRPSSLPKDLPNHPNSTQQSESWADDSVQLPADILIREPIGLAGSSNHGTDHESYTSNGIGASDSAGLEKDARSNQLLPIVNAGADAQIKIEPKLSERVGRPAVHIASPPIVEERMLSEDEARDELRAEVAKATEANKRRGEAEIAADDRPRRGSGASSMDNNIGSLPGGLDTSGVTLELDKNGSESFGNWVKSAVREELGLDEAEQLESFRHPEFSRGDQISRAVHGDVASSSRMGDPESGVLEKLRDWFWGDIIRLSNTNETPPEAISERVDGIPNEPFLPVQNGRPVLDVLGPAMEHAPDDQDHGEFGDVAPVGPDAEALEDQEDLEGIFELLGLHGPLVALFQTSTVCMLLVFCTIFGAVVLPYLWGKIVFTVIGDPTAFLVKDPLWVASVMADLVVDSAILAAAYVVSYCAWGLRLILDPLLTAPTWDRLIQYAFRVAAKSGHRLAGLSMGVLPNVGGEREQKLEWTLLRTSTYAHASLVEVKKDVCGVLDTIRQATSSTVNTVSSGQTVEDLTNLLKRLPELRTVVTAWSNNLVRQILYTAEFVTKLSNGTVSFSSPQLSLDPALVYWSPTDRALTILTGYVALAMLAAIYVAADTPISTSEAGRKHEKAIRDSLRQAGGILKVIIIIGVEMLVFPLYCGLLLDLAFLPLFADATVATRWTYANTNPYSFCFMHWFVGTCYMFHFALFVGTCRKILRPGVLWFIRDPDDPSFHPVKDVLERNVGAQLRKIAFSALVYGALVILCVGGVIWSIGNLVEGIFPLCWVATEPLIEFPFDLLLFNLITPLIIRIFQPSDGLKASYEWYLRRCARCLRLSHFLFLDRRREEEGRMVSRTWKATLIHSRLPFARLAASPNIDPQSEVFFRPSGHYALTPCKDQYRPPKSGDAVLHADSQDVYIEDRAGRRNQHFCKIYVPPHFRLRITLFMICLWLISVATGLGLTLLPLVFGRHLFSTLVPKGMQVNDIYAYSVGTYVLAMVVFVVVRGQQWLGRFRHTGPILTTNTLRKLSTEICVPIARCVYVYGFIGGALPLAIAFALQVYGVLPLHTAARSLGVIGNHVAEPTIAFQNSSATVSHSPLDQDGSAEGHHVAASYATARYSIHLLQEYALGLLVVRLISRSIFTSPASMPAEAIRRITARGYLNPHVSLTTRYVVLPTLIAAAVVFCGPLVLARLFLAATRMLSAKTVLTKDAQTNIYRYAFPAVAFCVLIMLACRQVAKAMKRWGARIRDEVYLVGQRLHNFGESRSLVAKTGVS